MRSATRFLMLFLVGLAVAGATIALAQDAAPVAADVSGEAEVEEAAGSTGFLSVVFGSGWMGVLLWLALFTTSGLMVWLVVDSFITVNEKKIMPEVLVTMVRESMEQGDVLKAIDSCDENPSPMSNILLAAFTNVEEGFETIQAAITSASDLETEKLLQRVTYLSVLGNLAPMLGLLGTVQGMIMAFANLGAGTMGAAQTQLLAMNISQALYTTAGGLIIAVPAVSFYYFFRNRANNLALQMEIITDDLIKALRNVEVVEE